MLFDFETDRLITGLFGEEGLWPTRWFRRTYPAVNIYGNEEKLLVTSEIPGLKLEDLQVSVSGRTLTLTGKRQVPELGEDECYACEERVSGDFERSIGLPYDVDAGKVEAGYRRGVLTLRLPRSESGKPKQIAIGTA